VVVDRLLKTPVELNKQSRAPRLHRYSTTEIPEEPVVGIEGPLNLNMQKSVKAKNIKIADSAPDKKSE
jgi:hypothetical protein